MESTVVRVFFSLFILALATGARAQEVGSRVPEAATNGNASQPGSPAQTGEAQDNPKDAPPSDEDKAKDDTSSDKDKEEDKDKDDDSKKLKMTSLSFYDRFCAMFSQQEDSDGPINTDRPTFTPANTVVPKGRLQIESGFTYNRQKSPTTISNLYDFPEVALRYGLAKRVEFRMFWEGQTYDQAQSRIGGPGRGVGGPNDTEVGFKWQLFEGDKDRKWIPTTALITSIIAPTGGTSLLSNQTVEPYINLIYGWSLTEKLTLAGSTGYLGIRQQPLPGSHLTADNLQRFHQSIVAFYTVGERSTLFYEWYVWTFTNSTNNLPLHFMDGGILYRLSTNTQLDLRAGFGLSGRPDDFFTGAGFSFRY